MQGPKVSWLGVRETPWTTEAESASEFFLAIPAVFAVLLEPVAQAAAVPSAGLEGVGNLLGMTMGLYRARRGIDLGDSAPPVSP